MNKLIIFAGMLATGKTTIAQQLSKNENFILLSKDKIKERISDDKGFTNREENKEISIEAVREIIETTRELMTKRKSIIVEANFRENEIKELINLSKEFNYSNIIIGFYGDYEILFKRFLARIPNRHKAHLSIGLDKDFNLFKEYNNEMFKQVKNFDFIPIDSTKFSLEEEIDIIKSVIISKNLF